MKYYISFTLAFVGLFAFFSWISLPTLSFDFLSFPSILLGLFIFLFFVNYVMRDMKMDNNENSDSLDQIGRILKIGSFITIIYIIVASLYSSSLFHTEDYHNRLGKVIVENNTSNLPNIDIEQVRIVDEEFAIKIGSKKIGEDPALGSRVVLGDFNIQTVNGKLFWVAPLNHSGFFKWLNKPEGTNGYIKVSATNPQDVELVQTVNNKPILLKYQKEAYFSDNLHRHLWLNGYMTKGLTDFSFEIDDQGNPFYIVTIYDHKIGVFGADSTGIAVVNPANGEIKEYSIDNAPQWIDRIQPDDFIISQINDWASFISSWFNAHFSKEGVLQTSQGISLVYADDNNSYWYTGLTSTGSDGATVGFMLVNTRTKEAFRFNQSGATETRAMKSAEGELPEKNYTASFPVLYNVLGVPTYVITLKNNEGLVKMVAMVNVEFYEQVGIGSNIQEALLSYKSKLYSKGNKMNLVDNVQYSSIIGNVVSLGSDIKQGNKYFYIAVDSSDKIFIVDSSVSQEIVLTGFNDTVEIKFENNSNKFISASFFDNKNF